MEKIRYAFGSFVLDVSEHRLWRDGQEIKILPQQFDLLVMFVQNPDHLFTYDEILNLKWADVYIDQASMQKAVGALSRLLGDSRKRRRYIETQHRKGYRWICPVKEVRDLDRRMAGVKESEEIKQVAANLLFDIRAYLQGMVFFHEFLATNYRAAANFLANPTREGISFEVLTMMNPEQQAIFLFELARKAEHKLMGAELSAWLDRLDAEGDNLRSALDYYRNKKSGALQELEFAIFLSRFWDIRGRWAESEKALQHALERQQPGDFALKAKGMTWLGWLSFRQGNHAAAEQLLSGGAKMSRQVGDKENLAFSLKCLGLVAQVRGNYQEANSLLAESLRLSQEVNSDRLIGEAFHGLGFVAEAEGNYALAKDLYLKYLDKSRKIQDIREESAALNCLGVVAREHGDYEEARDLHQKSLALRQGTGNTSGLSFCYFHLGLLEEAIGDYQAASSNFQKSLDLRTQVGNRLGIAKALEGLARVSAAMGQPEDAARIYGAAEAIRESINAPLSPSEQHNYGESRALIRKRFLGKWKDGRKRSPGEVVA